MLEIIYSQKIEDIDIATIFTPNELKKITTSKFNILTLGLSMDRLQWCQIMLNLN